MPESLDILRAIIQGIVEGVTEFLPVSSTGHMRLVERIMGPVVNDAFNRTFDIFIQTGAILAVIVYFRDKLLDLLGLKTPSPASGLTPLTPPQRRHLWLLLALATAPLAPGYFIASRADAFYGARPDTETLVIAWALLLGGVAMILIERFKPAPTVERMEDMHWRHALIIGLSQILAAVFPGTSRSMATIMPGLLLRLSRPVAAEFSFFLAIPALMGAGAVKLARFFREGDVTSAELILLAIGTITAFLVAYLVIAAFMGFVRRFSFTPFGIYRILLALAVFALLWL